MQKEAPKERKQARKRQCKIDLCRIRDSLSAASVVLSCSSTRASTNNASSAACMGCGAPLPHIASLMPESQPSGQHEAACYFPENPGTKRLVRARGASLKKRELSCVLPSSILLNRYMLYLSPTSSSGLPPGLKESKELSVPASLRRHATLPGAWQVETVSQSLHVRPDTVHSGLPRHKFGRLPLRCCCLQLKIAV